MFASLPMYQRIGAAAFKKDLTNTLALCEAIGNPQQKLRCIHIAGTNGKGSTTHFLAAILAAQGLRVGLYTSPHYRDFRERIKIGAEYISEQAVIAFIAENKAILERIEPSFFEMTVAMAFDYFAKQAVDIALIEVGLGGRLDSTNIITPLVSVITNISFDHQAMLGNTLVEIAGEKAGIIKPKIPVIISETQAEVKSVFIEKAAAQNAPIFFADTTYSVQSFENDYTNKMKVSILKNKIQVLDYQIDAFGEYQLKNMVGVLKTVDILNEIYGFGIEAETAAKGLSDVRALTKMQGRWQLLAQKPLIIADSGHNEGGLNQTMRQLTAICNTLENPSLHFVLGVVNDKTLDTMLALLPKNAVYYFAKADIPRGLVAEELQREARRFDLIGDTYSSVEAALAGAKSKASARDIIFIGGSCFTVAEVL
ncbi:MAG: hypothetical protein RI894_2152 [Bacteroidota bacterium]|jgi:dihydrofolate synthase/folylpolyglutamate synthase